VVLGEELESDNIILLHSNTLGGKGQSSTLTDLDEDSLGPDASGKTQESGNDGSETHVSDRKEVKERRRKVGSGSKDWRVFWSRWVERCS